MMKHDCFKINIPAPIDGVFVVDGIEKVIISQEIFCTPYFIYKNECIEYKEYSAQGKFQSLKMFTDYKSIDCLKKITMSLDENATFLNSRNEYSNIDVNYQFSSKDRKTRMSKTRPRIYLDIRIYYSQFFQYLRIKGIKSHQKQSVSLLYVLNYLKPELSLQEIKQIIIETVVEEDVLKLVDLIIPDSLPEDTLKTIMLRRSKESNESKEKIISIINKIIDNYLTPDNLHDDCNNDTKFYTYLTMARALFINSNKNYFSNRIDTFPFSMYHFIKYFTLENKNLPLNKFVSSLNIKLFSNVKSGTVRSYFRDYSSIAVQTLSKRSYYDKLSHIRRVQVPINTESEKNELRMSYEYGYFCPFETPESKDVGLVKYSGLSVLVAPDFSIDLEILAPYIYNKCELSNKSEKNTNNYPVLPYNYIIILLNIFQ